MWRSFKFFETESVKGPLDTLEISAACCGRSLLAFGDTEGVIHVYDRAIKVAQLEYQAYNGPVTHLKALRTRNVIVSVGDDDSVNCGIVRIWDLDKRDSQGRPQVRDHALFAAKYPPPDSSEWMVLRTNFNDKLPNIKFYGNKSAANSEGSVRSGIPASEYKTCIVAFDITEDLQYLTAALVTDEIILVRGDLERDRSPKIKRFRSGQTKEKLTFVGFPRSKQHESRQSGTFAALLFAVHEDMVAIWRITAKGETLESKFEPAMGAKYECSTINDEGELIIATWQTPQLTFYGGETFMSEMYQNWDSTLIRPHTYCEIDGEKRKILHHKGYIIVLARMDEKKPDRFTLGFYEPRSHIKALSQAQSTHANVGWILSDIGEVVVIAQDQRTSDTVSQRVTKFTELDTQAKLDQLFKKDMYEEAKKMAKRLQSGDVVQQMDIQRKYGDHLYDKGKYEQAIEQYIEAIGFLEPSYVIRKFLDSQRIANLTRYLEELHHQKHNKIANKNHTTLLLNCYTKLKDVKKLKEFIRQGKH